jgi:calcium/calmodulin-dependent 3',5'-cyclic nucleotide phosphodiesterase
MGYKLESVLGNVRSWNFDIFQAAKATPGRPLRFVAWEVLRLCGCFFSFPLDPRKTASFLERIEQRYATEQKTPYHNNIHAADVTQTCYALLEEIGGGALFDPMDQLVTIVGASIHDMGHDGRNNAFHVSTQDNLALTYNDRSVLENFHVSECFKLLAQEPDANFLSDFDKTQLPTIRRELIDVVLATDMAQHFARVGNFGKLSSQLHGSSDWKNDDEAMTSLRAMTLHAADISNPTKPLAVAQQWSARCLEEFFAQGDMERKLGLPISPMCNRQDTDLPTSQLGFIDFIVQPTFQALAMLLPRAKQVCLPELARNKEAWEMLKRRGIEEEERNAQLVVSV